MNMQPAAEYRLSEMLKYLIVDGVRTGKMTPDERHAYVVRAFPGSLTGLEFAALTLLSADDNEVVDPPSVGDWFQRQSCILRLSLGGLIERRCKRDEIGPYYLSETGREFLKMCEEP